MRIIQNRKITAEKSDISWTGKMEISSIFHNLLQIEALQILCIPPLQNVFGKFKTSKQFVVFCIYKNKNMVKIG